MQTQFIFTGCMDVDYYILNFLNDRDLLSFCITNKEIYKRIFQKEEGEEFWKRRSQKRYPKSSKNKQKQLNWISFYSLQRSKPHIHRIKRKEFEEEKRNFYILNLSEYLDVQLDKMDRKIHIGDIMKMYREKTKCVSYFLVCEINIKKNTFEIELINFFIKKKILEFNAYSSKIISKIGLEKYEPWIENYILKKIDSISIVLFFGINYEKEKGKPIQLF